MRVEEVGLVGCGWIGSGLAQACSWSGFNTVVSEVSNQRCEEARQQVLGYLDQHAQQGHLTAEDRDSAKSRLKFVVGYSEFRECDIVIECVPESLDAKREIFRELDSACASHCVLATSTSSLSVAEIGSATGRPGKVIGLHFMYPADTSPVVEVARTLTTSEETAETATSFVEDLGKEAVACKDSPGFVINRLLLPYLLDAVRAYEHGVASREDIDTAIRLGCGYPKGPLRLVDEMGLDTVLQVAINMFEEYRTPCYAPPPLLRRMVQAGYLGVKSGRGFYEYETESEND